MFCILTSDHPRRIRDDIPEHELEAGDVGAVVHRYEEGGYEVEFVSASGATLAVLTLTDADLRPMGGMQILHVRDLASL